MIEAFYIKESKVYHTEDLSKIDKSANQILIQKEIHPSGRRGVYPDLNKAKKDSEIMANGIEIEWNSYSEYGTEDDFVLKVNDLEIPGTKKRFKYPKDYCATLNKYFRFEKNEVKDMIYSVEMSKRILMLKKEIENLKSEKDILCADIKEIKDALSKIESVTQKNNA